MSKEELARLVALSTISKMNSKSLLKIKRAFIDLQDVWRANSEDFLKIGLGVETIRAIIEERAKLDPEKEWQKLEKEKLKVISLDEELYPTLLKQIYDPPPLLFYQGTLNKDKYPLACVGSRRLSFYGKQVIEEIIPPLSQNGATIISGLALGADAAAHATTLQAGGRTIAVLGSGANNNSIYPKENYRLAQQIINNGGAVISEFPIGTLPLRFNFPIRNRVISGLSLGTIIIEAAEDSGSLITAKLALDQNREVFSVPGNIFSPLSEGPNNLLKLGAQVITSAEDILDFLKIEKNKDLFSEINPLAENPTEEAILKVLSKEPKNLEKIAQETKFPTNVLVSAIALMELKNKIKNSGGMNYIIN